MQQSLKSLLSNDKVAGRRQVVRGIAEGRIRCVLIASDTDRQMLQELIALSEANGVEHIVAFGKEELGKELGLDVGCATVGFLK